MTWVSKGVLLFYPVRLKPMPVVTSLFTFKDPMLHAGYSVYLYLKNTLGLDGCVYFSHSNLCYWPQLTFYRQLTLEISLTGTLPFVSSSWLHHHAVWSGGWRCVYYGLQLPHVCPTSICCGSEQFWWQAGLWIVMNECNVEVAIGNNKLNNINVKFCNNY